MEARERVFPVEKTTKDGTLSGRHILVYEAVVWVEKVLHDLHLAK